MEGVSTAFRGLAQVLETVETVGTKDPSYEITALTPIDDNLLNTDTVSVELSVRIPFLTIDGSGQHLTLTPQNVQLNDDGSLQLEAVIAATTDTQEPAEDPSDTDAQTGAAGDKNPDDTAPQASPSPVTTNATTKSSESNTDATAGDATDSPAYRDPDQLRTVYEEYETFTEMTDALGVDVTPQTVRRYMIKHDIHEPTSPTGSQTTETLLDAEPESVSTATGTPPQQDRAAEAPGTTSQSSNGATASTPERASATKTIGTSNAESAEETPAPASEADASHVTASDDAHVDREGPGDADADADADTDSASADSDDDSVDGNGDEGVGVAVELPAHLTLDDIKTTVQNVRTLYEAQQQLDLDREEAQRLLQELNLLDLVHGRVATRNLTDRTIEDINRRLQSSTIPGPEQA